MPLRKHEMIYVFKGDKTNSSYNPQKTTGHKPMFHKAHKIKKGGVYGKTEVPDTYVDDTRHPHSILQFEEPSHEMVYVFKGNKPNSTYNPQKTTGHKSGFIKGSKKKNKDVYGTKETFDKYVDDTRHPTTILKFNNANQGGGTLHRTQKPVDLCECLIRTFQMKMT